MFVLLQALWSLRHFDRSIGVKWVGSLRLQHGFFYDKLCYIKFSRMKCVTTNIIKSYFSLFCFETIKKPIHCENNKQITNCFDTLWFQTRYDRYKITFARCAASCSEPDWVVHDCKLYKAKVTVDWRMLLSGCWTEKRFEDNK